MKNKSKLIKKIKKGLKLAFVTAVIATSLTSCGIMSQDFSSQEEILQVAETLDCDTSYLMQENNKFARMKHNDGEPIYVCFDKEYSEDLKEQAKESLDYIFGMVGKINNNYHYKIVDENEFWLKGNKTKIYYTYGEHVSTYQQYSSVALGHLEMHQSPINALMNNQIYSYYKLNINKEKLKGRDENSISNTLNHELLHAFGLGDVYTTKMNQTTEKHYGNTYMNTNIHFDMITPNDLACLISLYADDNCDIVKMKQELDKYENKFYRYYANLNKDRVETTEDFTLDSFGWSTHIIVHKLDGTKVGYKYQVEVDGEKYNFQIIDYFTNELIDVCEGEIFQYNGVMVLKNVNLKAGLRPYDEFDKCEGGFIQDLVIMKKNGKDLLYNYFNNDGMNGECYELEKSLTN